MGKQVNTQLEGSSGPVIFYRSRGEYLVRSKGKTGTQSPIAKQQASILGRASAISARLRAVYKPLIPGADRKLMYRMNNALQQWLRTDPLNNNLQVNEITPLKGFSLMENKYESSLQQVLTVTRDPGAGIIVQVPAFDSLSIIGPLVFNGEIKIKIMVACCNLQTGMSMRNFETSLAISYTGIPVPAHELTVPLEPVAGELTVVAASVNTVAAGIVAAMWN